MDRVLKKYKFEFYFYNNYYINFQKYFDEKSRLPIWNEETPLETMTAVFSEYEVINDKIIGMMDLLVPVDIDLSDIKSKKYLMNHPKNLVGHLILLD